MPTGPRPVRPRRLWVTGGLGPHAPDWVGMRVSRELGVPYVLVEPQIGEGTAANATAEEERSVQDAFQAAAAIVTTRTQSIRSLATRVTDPGRLIRLLPFLDLTPSLSAGQLRDTHRNALVGRRGLPPSSPCLVTDGSQELGPSQAAWQMLALALSRIVMLDWQLLVLGHGSAEQQVQAALRRLPRQRVHGWFDATSERPAAPAFAGSDLYVWPATDGSGLASLLEAQATGTPVVACSSPDVADRLLDGQTGRMAATNAESLANGISFLLRHPHFRQKYGPQARETAATQHDLRAAAEALRGILSQALLRPIRSS